jgi:mannose-6-phosphate isomerase
MPAQRLQTLTVAKPWGRHALGFGFPNVPHDQAPIGEIWFDAPEGADPDLMVKYLFTSERLSIQVHPNDADAQARGHKRGKDEAWVVLAAEPDATVALGTVRPMSREELRAAALDGSIEELTHWQPVKAGDVIYSPAGTVHAIGAGLTILEIQQNVDLTYRLYDYGRPRELHLEDGIAVSNPVPFEIAPLERDWGDGLHWTIEGPRIWMDCYKGREVKQGSASSDQWVWFVPLKGSGKVDGQCFHAGECWMLTGDFWITDAGNAEYILAHAVPA